MAHILQAELLRLEKEYLEAMECKNQLIHSWWGITERLKKVFFALLGTLNNKSKMQVMSATELFRLKFQLVDVCRELSLAYHVLGWTNEALFYKFHANVFRSLGS